MTFIAAEKHQSQIPALQMLVALGFEPLSQVFGDAGKRAFLGVDMIEPTFTADGGRIFGAQATASGKAAFDTLRGKLFEQFGVPTADSPYQHPETKWDWGEHSAVIDLTYDADHDRATLAITQKE